MLDRDAIDRVRSAIGAYFRAAGALSEASLLIRLVALAHRDVSAEEGESERAFLLDRAETYRDKAEHMSRSGAVLLRHATDWINNLGAIDEDEETRALAAFAEAIDDAARGYAEVVEALTATPLPEHPAYAELVDELRHAVRFLQTEAASFGEIAEDQ